MKKRASKKRHPHIILLGRLRKRFPGVKITEVKDSNQNIEIKVSKVDCKQAIQGSFENCALAKAGRRQLHADAVFIGLSCSYVIKNGVAIRYQTPVSVGREMVSFDRHHDFDEGTYHLAAVTPTQRLDSYYNRNKDRNRTKRTAEDGSRGPTRHIHKSSRVRRVIEE